jgi:hypothetical protein
MFYVGLDIERLGSLGVLSPLDNHNNALHHIQMEA